jgi:hypothetical protein
MRADRSPTTASRSRQERALGLDGLTRGGVVARCEQGKQSAVIRSDLRGDRSLSGGGQDDERVQDLAHAAPAAESKQTCHRQDEGVRLASIETPQPGVDIPVQRVHPQIRPQRV